jgi:hypothetical protein
LILLCNTLLHLNHAHLSDLLSASVVHQDIDFIYVWISPSARRNSGERLPKAPSTSTCQISPPAPPRPPEIPGKNPTAQIPLQLWSSSTLCALPMRRLTPVASPRRCRKQESPHGTPLSSPSPAEQRRDLHRHQRLLEHPRHEALVRQDPAVNHFR